MSSRRSLLNEAAPSGGTPSRWPVWLSPLAPFTQRLEGGQREPTQKARANRQGAGGRIYGTVVSLGGRFPHGSARFRFERMEMLDTRRASLVAFPIHETAEVASSLSLGMQVIATIRDGAIVSVKKRPNMSAPPPIEA